MLHVPKKKHSVQSSMKWTKLAVLLNFLVLKCWAMTQSELDEFSDFIEKTSQLDLNLKSNPDVDADDEETALDNAWEESGKFEGDLILNEKQRRTIVENVAEGLSRNGIRDSTKRWPDNEVIYFIQREHFNEDQLQAIRNGIDDIAQAACVKFRPYQKGDRDAVVIQGSRRGCFSQVGYQGGYQVLNLNGRHPVGRGCFRHGTVVHELLHTLGFYHMQSSPDRDDYIDVIWANILEPARHNFRKYNTFSVSDFGVGYDYDSVLHYSKKAFSLNGKDTLVPKQNGAAIGQRLGLSEKDTQKLNKMYCDADSNRDDDGSHGPQKNKKESSKNKPFEGHGIGYHQGKTVVIKLPAAETYRLPDLPSFHIFDYFSKTPQAVSQTSVEKDGYGRGITFLPNIATTMPDEKLKHVLPSVEQPDQYSIMRQEKFPKANDMSEPTLKENNGEYQSNTEQNLKKMFSQDEEVDDKQYVNIRDEFDKLNKIIKTHVYPSEEPEDYKIKNDYSKFYISDKKFNRAHKGQNLGSKNEPINLEANTESDILDEHYANDNLSYSAVQSPKNFMNNSKNVYLPNDSESLEEDMDSSFRTSFPINKQNYFIQNVNSKPINRNLFNRNNYGQLYKHNNSTRDTKQHKLFEEKVPTENDWNSNDEFKRHTGEYDVKSYSNIGENNDALLHDLYKTTNPDYQHLKRHNFGNSNSAPYFRKGHLLFGVPVPLTKTWYKTSDDDDTRTDRIQNTDTEYSATNK